MEKEFIRETKRSVTLNVTAGRIDSFREIERTSGTVRVYENGCVGVAGCLGEPNEAELTEKAKEALRFSIPYPCRLEGPLDMAILREEEIIPVPDLIPTMQEFLSRLGEACPKFAFSNKIMLEYDRSEYTNSAGRRLVSAGGAISLALIAQNRGSCNLFDTLLEWSGDRFDPDALIAQFKKEYEAFFKPASLAPGRYPVVAAPSGLFGTFFPHFTGDMYAAGASLLSGKLGQKVFSEKLSLRDDRNSATAPGACFFDAEGCTAPDLRPTLIENGVLRALLTTKKSAEQYGLPNFGSASADYDEVPQIGFNRFYPDATAKTLGELVPGKAIYVVVASGGDTTPDGHFATPVQMAYLIEDGEPVGRLPELSISGSFFDMLGKDYIGAVHDEPLKGNILCAVEMDAELG